MAAGAVLVLLLAHGPLRAAEAAEAAGLPASTAALPAAAASAALISEARPAAADPALEARMMALAAVLRCLVCQNQTIADSHAELAQDLRQQIREMLARGLSDREITDYMTARYGDFVLYRPPFKPVTAVLWLGPAALLLLALGALARVLRQRQRLGDDAFEPDDGEATAADGDAAHQTGHAARDTASPHRPADAPSR